VCIWVLAGLKRQNLSSVSKGTETHTRQPEPGHAAIFEAGHPFYAKPQMATTHTHTHTQVVLTFT